MSYYGGRCGNQLRPGVLDIVLPSLSRYEAAVKRTINVLKALTLIGHDLDIFGAPVEQLVPLSVHGAVEHGHPAIVETHDAAADQVDGHGVITGRQYAALLKARL